MFEYFNENQQVFSSIDRFRTQVSRKQLRWGPCHTEEFWKENFIHFERKENLELIGVLANDCLEEGVENRIKAVACHDLGEFARFFPQGKEILNRHNVKAKMTMLMQSKMASSEVKKEAITCY